MNMTIGLIVPTLNAGPLWENWLKKVQEQTVRPDRILVIDSSSDDATTDLARVAGCDVVVISRKEFNHGSTRQMGANLLAGMDILVYMTQDAVLADTRAIERLVVSFVDRDVAAAYGRQLPHLDSGAIGAHARLFNYPENSVVRDISKATEYGFKVTFISNSFSAYRNVMLRNVGGFPKDNIFGEDTFVAAKLLLSNGKIAYCADALVYHSHDYSYAQDFRRCFDIGVFHSREPWMRQEFGRAEGEGKKFVISELKFLFKTAPWLIPTAFIRTFLKYFGYKLGTFESKLPLKVKINLSMHRGFWDE